MPEEKTPPPAPPPDPDPEAELEFGESGDPLEDATELLRRLLEAGERPPKVAKPAGTDAAVVPPGPPALIPLASDEEVIRLIRRDARASALWDGHWEGLALEDSSHSGADFALMQRAAFYTAKNPSQMDRLMRRSSLFREEKWDSPRPGGTYGSLTIERAIEATSDVYSRRRPGGAAPAKRAGTPSPGAADVGGQAAAPAAAEVEPPPVPEGLNLLPYTHDDMGNADRLKLVYGERLKYAEEEKGWYVWGEGQWKRSDTDVRSFAQATAAEFKRQAPVDSPSAKFARECRNHARLANMLLVASSQLAISSTKFDARADLLNCSNGTVDLTTGELRSHRREDYITRKIDADYFPAAPCPQFLAFLARIMGHTPDASEGELAEAEEKLDYLQLALGYSITGETSEKAVFVAHGPEDTGKTTLLGLVRSLLGSYSTTIPLEVIMTHDRSNTAEALKANLRGARFAQSSETEEGQRISAAMLKRISQGPGGRITACRKYENPIDFRETHKLWIDANHKPELSASDSAAWRRLHLIPFLVQIPKAEQDQGLLERLLRDESSGILAWLVEGARRWYAKGLPKSQVVDKATEDWREEVNRLKAFLDDATVPQLTAEVPNKNLYGSYKSWCEENGERPLSHRRFADQMKHLGYENKRSKDGMDWIGLRFRLP